MIKLKAYLIDVGALIQVKYTCLDMICDQSEDILSKDTMD